MPPPWNHTSTGAPWRAPTPGVETFRYSESSDWGPAGVNGVGPGWIGLGANSVASRTPAHLAGGCGGLHRKSPVGGAAYGIPRKAYPSVVTRPRTLPSSVVTIGAVLAVADVAPALSESSVI